MKKIGFIVALLALVLGLAFTINSIVKGLYVEMAIFATMASMAIFYLLFQLLINRQKKKGIVPRPVPTLNPPLPDEMILSPGIDKIFRYVWKHIKLIAVVSIIFILSYNCWIVKTEDTLAIIYFSFCLGIVLDSVIFLFYKKLKHKKEPMAEAL
ncbi:MAG TPA: hypothetical protein VFC92_01560 [Bacteroidales bacterium]|nr:hypothetical protein [Bacteroidales bacterium]